jgi:hypothetical protein
VNSPHAGEILVQPSDTQAREHNHGDAIKRLARRRFFPPVIDSGRDMGTTRTGFCSDPLCTQTPARSPRAQADIPVRTPISTTRTANGCSTATQPAESDLDKDR